MAENKDGKVFLDVETFSVEKAQCGRFNVNVFVKRVPNPETATDSREVIERWRFSFPWTQFYGIVGGDPDSKKLVFPRYFADMPGIGKILIFLKNAEASLGKLVG